MRYFVTLNFKGYQKYDRSKLKRLTFLQKEFNFQLWLVIFVIPFNIQGHTVPHWKACDPKGLCQAFLKSAYLLHKQGFPMASTVFTLDLQVSWKNIKVTHFLCYYVFIFFINWTKIFGHLKYYLFCFAESFSVDRHRKFEQCSVCMLLKRSHSLRHHLWIKFCSSIYWKYSANQNE